MFGLLLLAIGLGVGAQHGLFRSAPPTGEPQSLSIRYTPVEAAESWFQAVNNGNAAAAKSHFAPQSVDMMEWSGNGTTFSDLHCRQLSRGTTSADVLCTFHESGGDEGNPDSFWTISFQRQPGGPWLINNYGQG